MVMKEQGKLYELETHRTLSLNIYDISSYEILSITCHILFSPYLSRSRSHSREYWKVYFFHEYVVYSVDLDNDVHQFPK
jgi:hypothetical protein